MRRWILVLFGLLGVALVALVMLAPKFQMGNSPVFVASLISGTSLGGGSLQQTQQISQLEAEVQRLKEAITQEQAAKGGSLAAAASDSSQMLVTKEETSVTVDLMKFLGVQSFYAGVSWDPLTCMPPYKTAWPDISDETIQNITHKLSAELRSELAKIKGIKPEGIDENHPYMSMVGGVNLGEGILKTDPHFTEWRERIMYVLTKYMPRGPDRVMVLHDFCEKVKGKTFMPEDMGTSAVDCSDELTQRQVTDAIGYYALPYESIRSIAHGLLSIGTCSSQIREHRDSYAQWLRMERIFHKDWMTFAVQTPEQDAAVLLFDVLYERLAVFTKQYWLGVITMQNPFDMYSIQDIIFTQRPDVLIETGTANGGSALLWASIMHLADMENSTIITMDVNTPKWEGSGWGGHAREDPTKHKLWKKHVTFLHGNTVDDIIVNQVKKFADNRQVMVLLDSHHTEVHVTMEMEIYCPLVSVGSYCIVEDTKMSRWASTGPLEAVKKFLTKHPEFELDRTRELLYSHHAMGYLRRSRM